MKRILLATFVLLSVLVTVACSATSATIDNRNKVMGERSAESNFLEAQQVAKVEDWKDTPGKIVNVYILNTVTGSLWVPPIQCMGVPNSSTESLEPNNGRTWA